MTDAGVIRAEGLTRRFGNVTAVRPFNMQVKPGQVTGLLGPNGAGKSTLLRMLIGLVTPSGGTCCVDGVPLTRDGAQIRKRVAYAPGELGVFGEWTAAQHITWLMRGRAAGAVQRARSMAASFDLPLDRRVRGFSHGMKRQLFVAAALAPDVPVRILDEPTEGLDPTRRRQVLDLIARDAEDGTTILLSSHHLGEVERVCSRMLFMRSGDLLDEARTRRLHAQLRRALRITWKDPIDAKQVREQLSSFENVHLETRRATVILGDDDPRAAIAQILALPALPAPVALTFGELTLHDLYRALYGEEGV